MQWALYTLGLNKIVQKNLRNHLLITDILECDLLNNILKEVLRMYPLAPFITRKFSKDIYLSNHIIPANVCCIINWFFHVYKY